VGRTWGTSLTALALAAITLTGCSSSAPPAEEPPQEAATVEETGTDTDVVAAGPDLTDPAFLADACRLTEDALNDPNLTNAASMDVPEYWAANFPAVPGDGHVYCEQTLNSASVTTTWVILGDTVADFPVLEQWVNEASAAGGFALVGAGMDSTRQAAHGEISGTTSTQLTADGKPYLAGFRSFGDDRYLQIWIQPAP